MHVVLVVQQQRQHSGELCLVSLAGRQCRPLAAAAATTTPAAAVPDAQKARLGRLRPCGVNVKPNPITLKVSSEAW
jgi:hypothetical protein